MNLNNFTPSMHCQLDHQERWDRMQKVVNNDLGEIIFSVYDGKAYLCISNTGVYAVIDTVSKTLITAYLPSKSRLDKLYQRANQETPIEIIRIIRKNEKKEKKIINGWL